MRGGRGNINSAGDRSDEPEARTRPIVYPRNAGVIRGYVLKGGRVGEVVSAVRAVLKGGSYFSPEVAKEIVEQLRSPQRGRAEPFSVLSGREREVLLLIAEGLSAKEIAVDLGISPKTVEAHRTNVMRKLGAHKATELVRYALRHGLIEP